MAAAEPADLDLDTLHGIRALGEDLLLTFVADFRRVAPNDIATVRKGLAVADGEAVGRAAHRLKGTCLVLGAVRMAGVAAEIEGAAFDGHLDRVAALVPALERSCDDVLVALEAVV